MRRDFDFTHRASGISFTVTLDIDLQEVARELAARAFVNKNEKAKAMRGAIAATIVRRQLPKVVPE